MLPLEEACERILRTLQPLAPEAVPLTVACGRVLAEDVVAPIDLPAFDNSAMDGYAVRAADLVSAKNDSPVVLKLSGQISAGEVFFGPVEPASCVRIFTGSLLPQGADAVVMQEDTQIHDTKPAHVWFLEPVKPWENVRLRGEDTKRGATIAAAGERLTSTKVGLFAAMGLPEVKVRRRPLVGLLATGSELTEAGQPLSPGKIYESNRLVLASLLRRASGVPRILPIVPDTLGEMTKALEEAFTACDAVVSCGGVSVGEFDLVKKAFEELGGTLDFWKVNIRPGKPFVFGRWKGKYLFGLPGNPVSAFVTFLLLVRPALLRLQGATRVGLPSHGASLAEPLFNRGERRHFVRVHIDERGQVRSAGRQASHALSSLAGANALLDLPPNTALAEGTMVRVLRIDE